jgi:hypothetical protein
MRLPRFRTRTLMVLVVIVAAFLGGMRFGEFRALSRPTPRTVDFLPLIPESTIWYDPPINSPPSPEPNLPARSQ